MVRGRFESRKSSLERSQSEPARLRTSDLVVSCGTSDLEVNSVQEDQAAAAVSDLRGCAVVGVVVSGHWLIVAHLAAEPCHVFDVELPGVIELLSGIVNSDRVSKVVREHGQEEALRKIGFQPEKILLLNAAVQFLRQNGCHEPACLKPLFDDHVSSTHLAQELPEALVQCWEHLHPKMNCWPSDFYNTVQAKPTATEEPCCRQCLHLDRSLQISAIRRLLHQHAQGAACGSHGHLKEMQWESERLGEREVRWRVLLFFPRSASRVAYLGEWMESMDEAEKDVVQHFLAGCYDAGCRQHLTRHDATKLLPESQPFSAHPLSDLRSFAQLIAQNLQESDGTASVQLMERGSTVECIASDVWKEPMVIEVQQRVEESSLAPARRKAMLIMGRELRKSARQCRLHCNSKRHARFLEQLAEPGRVEHFNAAKLSQPQVPQGAWCQLASPHSQLGTPQGLSPLFSFPPGSSDMHGMYCVIPVYAFAASVGNHYLSPCNQVTTSDVTSAPPCDSLTTSPSFTEG